MYVNGGLELLAQMDKKNTVNSKEKMVLLTNEP